MTELPVGTVTLVFTDIEGSTRLLTALGSRYETALADHRRLLRTAFSSHQGIEVDTQGDALFYAFSKAHDAVTAAVEAHRSIFQCPTGFLSGSSAMRCHCIPAAYSTSPNVCSQDMLK